MDHTKTKTFIAFINVSGKDRWWIDGNCTFEVDRPTILPYETEEQKKTAMDVGRTKGMWDETTDVHGVILKIGNSPFEIITRKEADVILKEIKEKEELRKLEQGVFDKSPKKKEKVKVDKKVKPELPPAPKREAVVKEKVLVAKEKSSKIESKVVGKAKFTIEE